MTQCPIQTGQTYSYNFTITGQRGTLFWHAHISWLRATVYGPIVILPRRNESYPFPKPHKEVPIIFGKPLMDIQKVLAEMLFMYLFMLSHGICRRVVECRPRGGDQPGPADGRRSKCFRCVHHQRSSRSTLQLFLQR